MIANLGERMKTHLEGMGFTRKRKGLYSKPIGPRVILWLDYRDGYLNAYAYSGGKRLEAKRFNEYHAAVKIEKILQRQEGRGTLVSYVGVNPLLAY